MTTSLFRLPAALTMTGQTRSTHYRRIREGLMTPPVKLGERCAAWPAREIEAINAARVSGKSNDEIRKLVLLLERQRKVNG